MIKNINTRSNDELKKIIAKGVAARKAVRKEMDKVFCRGWELKQGKYKLDWLINESKEELGRRKASRCGAMKVMKEKQWGGSYSYCSCAARELSFNHFSHEDDLFREHCCTCRWKPAQAQTRMVILRIKNGKDGKKR